MNTVLLRGAQKLVLLVATLALTNQGISQAIGPAAAFAAENLRSMNKMMDAMNVASSGNVDRDFVAMMTPHHQGAIDMALSELRFGRDETLRRMAQEIIVEQQQEIVAMRLAADKLMAMNPPGLDTSDVSTGKSSAQHMHGVRMKGN